MEVGSTDLREVEEIGRQQIICTRKEEVRASPRRARRKGIGVVRAPAGDNAQAGVLDPVAIGLGNKRAAVLIVADDADCFNEVIGIQLLKGDGHVAG